MLVVFFYALENFINFFQKTGWSKTPLNLHMVSKVIKAILFLPIGGADIFLLLDIYSLLSLQLIGNKKKSKTDIACGIKQKRIWFLTEKMAAPQKYVRSKILKPGFLEKVRDIRVVTLTSISHWTCSINAMIYCLAVCTNCLFINKKRMFYISQK